MEKPNIQQITIRFDMSVESQRQILVKLSDQAMENDRGKSPEVIQILKEYFKGKK